MNFTPKRTPRPAQPMPLAAPAGWTGGALININSTAASVAWPTQGVDAKSKALIIIRDHLRGIHALSSDVTVDWGIYADPSGGGLLYILRRKDDIKAKLKVFKEVMRRGKVLCKKLETDLGPEHMQAKELRRYFDTELLTGVCPMIECDRGLGAGAGAMASATRDFKIVYQEYPLGDEQQKEWQSITPVLNNRYDSFTHELAHVACGGRFGKTECKDHGQGWCEMATLMNQTNHLLGLRTFNARWRCQESCGNCGSRTSISAPCRPLSNPPVCPPTEDAKKNKLKLSGGV